MITSHRRQYDVILAPNAHWGGINVNGRVAFPEGLLIWSYMPGWILKLSHAATAVSPSEPSGKMGICFESGKDKAVKGDGRASSFMNCAKDTVAL